MVRVDDLRYQPVVLGIITDDPQLEVPIDELGRDLAGETASNLNFNLRIGSPIPLYVAKQI